MMFDLEKFKTGKYYVHLPTQELYDEVMEFLKENRIMWRSGDEMDYLNWWPDERTNTIISYNKERGKVERSSLVRLTSYEITIGQLLINKPKNKSSLVSPFRKNIWYEEEAVVPSLRKLTKGNNMVESPNHYIGELGLEVEEVLRNFIPRYKNSYVGHRVASGLEYFIRAPYKNGLEDLKKGVYNLQQAIKFIEDNNIEL